MTPVTDADEGIPVHLLDMSSEPDPPRPPDAVATTAQLIPQTEHVETVSATGRQCFVDGADVDEVLALFAVNRLGIIAAIRAARLTFDLSLVDARHLVESSQPYNSKYAAAVDWHQEVLQRLKPALEALRELDR
ncbi:hypothetical protein [Actinoplanes regularis]|uniref:hypothetical protein n=1 Tax=Actinoplanes regularis TaxID=52697 RepID=UPI0024A4A5E6|nr:hypothetical protein [Actinoplanes regularis]GLW31813.1 hypothetical protein Areg01_47520 [Actinoplanes regularis]